MAGRKRLQCVHPPLIISRPPPVRLPSVIHGGRAMGLAWGTAGHPVGLAWGTPGRLVGLAWGTRQVARPGQGMPPYAPRRYYADILGNCAYSEEDCAKMPH